MISLAIAMPETDLISHVMEYDVFREGDIKYLSLSMVGVVTENIQVLREA